jgi:hypothetical protein
VLRAEIEEQPGRRDFHARHWILRDRSLLVLDFDRQIVALQHGAGDFHDLCQFGRLEPMVFVVGHPDLKQAGVQRPDRTAAVDEVFLNPPHFSDVVVVWNK